MESIRWKSVGAVLSKISKQIYACNTAVIIIAMATTSKSTPSNDILAAERDAKFKVWLQNKTLRDKAFEYLGKLDKDRAKSEESCKQVAVSLCAIDRLLGEDGEVGANNENDADNMRGAVAPPKVRLMMEY